MNAKQSLKIVSARLADVETVLARAQADIKAYNNVIDAIIDGKSPCPWCEDYRECQLQAKDGTGCSEWWLAYNREENNDGAGNESEGILQANSESRGEAQDPTSQIKAF